MSDRRRRIGAEGEAAVGSHYQREGYEVLARNWRCRDGELDLVVTRRSTVVFCEVKTRSSDRFGAPAAAVGRDKQRRLRILAVRWLREADRSFDELRFDVASVHVDSRGYRVEVIEGAF